MKQLSIFLLSIVITFFCNVTFADTPKDTIVVESVYDGDTFTIMLNGELEKVRILGVDAPELKKSTKTYCLGGDIQQYVESQLKGKSVILVRDSESKNRDSFGRLLRYVFLDGTDFGKNLINKGYAAVYVKEKFDNKSIYLNIEKVAKIKKHGIWGNKCTQSIETKDMNKTEKSVEPQKPAKTPTVNLSKPKTLSSKILLTPALKIKCARNPYCTTIKSCEEAYFFLNTCNIDRLDVDGDGIPCENMCNQ